MDFLRGYAAFLDYRYWLNLRPVPLGPSLVGDILSFFGWFLLMGIAARVAARLLRKTEAHRAELFRRFGRMLMSIGTLGMLCLFFAYEQVPLLSMRLWFLLTCIGFVAWLVRCSSFAVKEYPRLQAELAERRRLEKYLPKKK